MEKKAADTLLARVLFSNSYHELAKLHALGAMKRMGKVLTSTQLEKLLVFTDAKYNWLYHTAVVEIAAASENKIFREKIKALLKNDTNQLVKRKLEDVSQ